MWNLMNFKIWLGTGGCVITHIYREEEEREKKGDDFGEREMNKGKGGAKSGDSIHC